VSFLNWGSLDSLPSLGGCRNITGSMRKREIEREILCEDGSLVGVQVLISPIGL